MTLGLVGRKCGMTRVFDEDGETTPVSVIQVEPNIVTQIKTAETDGYSAIQVTTGTKKRSRVTKAVSGHFAKAKVEPGRGLWEFSVDLAEEQFAEVAVGHKYDATLFEAGQIVDVIGITKGKGFQGPVKRHNFSMQDATHGNSLAHRAHGSTGQNQTPGRTFKNKKMAGQMGNVRRTVQNLEVVRVDAEMGVILVKGGVPGHENADVIIQPAVKAVK
ncbi:50S ribosomal protein L3 [Thiotrichales bacterium 19S9-12]|nr:50S ribosomal protein L3 [Thiotrichales bacterium 19S9-11]MCF6811605.1 50S ribosomal protein L3 [Thiotrichales bacterium 19S9-12]